MPFKVHAFKVANFNNSEVLQKLFQRIVADDLRDRIRLTSGHRVRAEVVQETEDGVWLLDFVKIRQTHGPGRVGEDSPVTGFRFRQDEGFGEETAVIYDPATEHLICQYNHYGVRYGVIQAYLSQYNDAANNIYQLLPKVDPEVERKYQRQAQMTKLNLSIDTTRMTNEDRARGESLRDAIQFGRGMNGEKIAITVSVSAHNRENGLGEQTRHLVGQMRDIFSANPEAVEKLEVSGRESPDDKIQILDLLNHRLVAEFDDLAVGNDLRYPLEERYRALMRVRNAWQGYLT